MMDLLEFIQKHWGLVATVMGSVWAGMKLSMDSKYPKRSEIDEIRKNIDQGRYVGTYADQGRFKCIKDFNDRNQGRNQHHQCTPFHAKPSSRIAH